jgi:RNA polymerase sigma-70 factor (ECF subfamily)
MFWLGIRASTSVRQMTDDELMMRIGHSRTNPASPDVSASDPSANVHSPNEHAQPEPSISPKNRPLDRVDQAKVSFDELYRRHAGLVLGYSQRLLSDRAAAEDTAQETWMKLIRASQTYRPQNQFRPWLLTLTRNTALSRQRQRRLFREVDSPIEVQDSLVDERSDLQQTLSQNENHRIVRQAIDRLPDAMRVCLALRWIEDLDYEAIVQATGLSLPHVKTLIHRGRQRLRQILSESPGLKDTPQFPSHRSSEEPT